MANSENTQKKIRNLSIEVKELQAEIKQVAATGGDLSKSFDEVTSRIKKLVDSYTAAQKDAEKLWKKSDPSEYSKALNALNTILGNLAALHKKVATAAKKANDQTLKDQKKLNDEYERGFKKLLEEEKRIESLKENIALKNIRLSDKEKVEKLQDTVDYYNDLQKKYKADSEEYLKVEKKKVDAELKLKKERERLLRSEREADLKAAFQDLDKKEAAEKELRRKIAEGNKKRSKEVTDFEKRQQDRRAAYYAKKEKEKTKTHKQEVDKRARDEKRRDLRGGFLSQFSPRAIGGALGSLTKYLGLYRALQAGTRVFNELTLGSIKQAIEFQASLAELSAVAGVASDKVKELGENALEVAGATKFTANDIVKLQIELSKLGFTAEQVTASTQAIAFTAQALGSPLEATAATVGKITNQFGLLAEESSLIGDIIVTSINKSALSFDSFNTAIQYIGPVANQMGLNLQQTAGAMAALADAGFTASRVGTGLRGILTELSKTSYDAEEALKELASQNVTLAEAVELVGKRNAAQLLVLLKNVEVVDEANEKYNEHGRALESASKQTNTFKGQMGLVNSAFQQLQINMGKTIAETKLMVTILGLLSKESQSTALGLGAIQEISDSPFGFQLFDDAAKQVSEGADSFKSALDLLVSTGQITQEESDFVFGLSPEEMDNYYNAIAGRNQELVKTTVGLQRALEQQAIVFDKTAATQRGVTKATNEYKDIVEELQQKNVDGLIISDETNDLYEQMGDRIEQLSDEIDKNQKAKIGEKTLSERTVLAYKGEIRELERLQGILAQIFNESDDRKKDLRNRAKDNLKDDLNILLDDLKNQLKEIWETPRNREGEYDIRLDFINLTFGQVEEILRQAEERFGKEFADDLRKTVQKAVGDETIPLFSPDENSIIQLPTKDAVKTYFETTAKEYAGAAAEGLRLGAEQFDQTGFWEATVFGLRQLNMEEIIGPAVNAVGDALSDFNSVALENTQNRVKQELELIKSRYSTEEEILRNQLNSNLITESQYRSKREELRKKQVAEENIIEKKLFDAQQKRDRQNATTDYLQSLASIIPNLIVRDKEGNPLMLSAKYAVSAAMTTAAYGAELSAISQRKFYPKKFEQGGVVDGPSHSQGGVPFTVQGQGGYEMEGGEFIVNKRASSIHRQLLESINNSVKPNTTPQPMKFATGGLVSNNVTNISKDSQESVNYLKAIAQATMSTATDVKKPVRAFVSSKDLVNNETERRLRERNDRI